MNDIPDILGMELHDAAALLEAEGLTFMITETKPVKKEVDGVLRVIRVRSEMTLTGTADHETRDQRTGPNILLTVCKI